MSPKKSSHDRRPTRSASDSGLGKRDYAAISAIGEMADDVAIGPDEVAAITGLSIRTVKQRRISNFPRPIPGVRRLRWRLGAIREWLRSGELPIAATKPTPRARGPRCAY